MTKKTLAVILAAVMVMAFMCGVVMICLLLGSRPRDKSDRLYFNMLLCNMGALFFDAMALLFRGHPGMVAFWGVHIFNFASFASSFGLIAAFNHYLTVYLGVNTEVSQKPLKVTRGLCLAGLVLLVLTQFLPIFYTIDASNIYHRADFFWLSHAIAIACVAIDAGMLIVYSRQISRQEKVALWSYIALPAAAICVQIFIYGVILVGLADTITMAFSWVTNIALALLMVTIGGNVGTNKDIISQLGIVGLNCVVTCLFAVMASFRYSSIQLTAPSKSLSTRYW